MAVRRKKIDFSLCENSKTYVLMWLLFHSCCNTERFFGEINVPPKSAALSFRHFFGFTLFYNFFRSIYCRPIGMVAKTNKCIKGCENINTVYFLHVSAIHVAIVRGVRYKG